MKSDKKVCIVYGKLYDEKLKTEFLQACREKKPFPVENIVTLSANNPMRGKVIYVKSQLTSDNRLLATKARKQKKDGKLLYVWEREGRILIRKAENTPAVEIQSMSQLMSLTSPDRNAATSGDEEDADNEENNNMSVSSK
jgi:hypothetical protein